MFERALGVSVILNLELKEKKIIFRLHEAESGKKRSVMYFNYVEAAVVPVAAVNYSLIFCEIINN